MCIYVYIHINLRIFTSIYIYLLYIYIHMNIYTRIDIDRDIDINITILKHTSIYILFSEHTTETSPTPSLRSPLPCLSTRGISACEKGSVWRQAKG